MKLPEDFENRVFDIFSSKELNEVLMIVYRELSILALPNFDAFVLSPTEMRYMANNREIRKLPIIFDYDINKTSILEVFNRDSLVQELFQYEFIDDELLVTIKEPGNVTYSTSPIGIFDSGVGGLSVLRAMRAHMPEESILYFGDQGHIPYGPRSMEQIRSFSEAITRFLLEHHAKIIVVACNTASAAALKFLRTKFPNVQFVGMEPAVKPAAEQTTTGRVGVLATPATFQGALYASVVERFANGVELFQNTCTGLVQEIEQGNLNGTDPRRILESALLPMLENNIDTVVLGCTHYPFVIPLIEEIVGDKVRVIDPAPAVAKQTQRLLEADGLKSQSSTRGDIRFFTSGEVASLKSILPLLLGEEGEIERVAWLDDSSIK